MSFSLLFPKEVARNPHARVPAMAHEVPIATIRDGLYVLTDGSLTAVYRVTGLDYGLKDMTEVAQHVSNLRSMLNVCPPDVGLKIIHRIHSNYRDLLDEHDRVLDGKNHLARYIAWQNAKSMQALMMDGRLLRSENLICLNYNPGIQWWEGGSVAEAVANLAAETVLKGKVFQRAMASYQAAMDKFRNITQMIESQMGFAGIQPARLDDKELYELAWQVLNPELSMVHPCPQIQKPRMDEYAGLLTKKPEAKERAFATALVPESERAQLCQTDWLINKDYVKVGDKYVGAIAMRMLPTHVSPDIGVRLSSIPFPCTIALDAIMIEKSKELSKRWSAAKAAIGAESLSLFGGVANPEQEALAKEKRESHAKLMQNFQMPFLFRMTITVEADSEKELKDRCDRLTSLLNNLYNTQGMRERYEVDQTMKMAWPFAVRNDTNLRRAVTTEVAAFLPIYNRWEGAKRPTTLFLDQMNRIVKHDPFPEELPNRNKVICGKSGSGKSFASQLVDVQPHAARANTEILVVESGGSFELTTRCFGGTFIKLGPTSKYSINPFDLPPGFYDMPDAEQEEQLRYKYGFIKNLCLCMARISSGEMKMVSENVLGSVVADLYESCRADRRTPKFRDFYRMLGRYRNPDDADAERIAGKLRTLLSNYVINEEGKAGIYARYFDCDTTFDVESPMIGFDLVDVKNDPALLTPTAMVVILGLIYNRILKRDGKERLIIVDEAWALIKENTDGSESPAGQGIELFWREGRKMRASSCMISQNYADMTGDKIGRAVVGNSPIQYFLVHEQLASNTESFKNAGFSDTKMKQIYQLRTEYGQFSEILVRRDREEGVIRLPSAGLKYWIATTDAKDLEKWKEYRLRYGKTYGLSEIVVGAILAEDYPGGTHGNAVHPPMSQDDALRFAERWQDHYRRFCALVDSGARVPSDFA